MNNLERLFTMVVVVMISAAILIGLIDIPKAKADGPDKCPPGTVRSCVANGDGGPMLCYCVRQ
jgi:hypothetical protein